MYSDLFSEASVQGLLDILPTFPTALWETFYVTVLSTALSLVIGLPLGVLLVAGEKDGVRPLPIDDLQDLGEDVALVLQQGKLVDPLAKMQVR